jgi:hypothetical protein
LPSVDARAAGGSTSDGTRHARREPVIDAVLRSPDDREHVLLLVEPRPWREQGAVDELADRINRTVSYVLDGRLAADLPETAGRAVRVHVDHLQPADADVEAFFLLAEARLALRGIGFSSELVDADGDPVVTPGRAET